MTLPRETVGLFFPVKFDLHEYRPLCGLTTLVPPNDFPDRPHSSVVVFESLPDINGFHGACIPALEHGAGDREEKEASLQWQDKQTKQDQAHVGLHLKSLLSSQGNPLLLATLLERFSPGQHGGAFLFVALDHSGA